MVSDRRTAERTIVVTVVLGAMLAPLNSTMITVGLPDRGLVFGRHGRLPAVGWQLGRPLWSTATLPNRAYALSGSDSRRRTLLEYRGADRRPHGAGGRRRHRYPERHGAGPFAYSARATRPGLWHGGLRPCLSGRTRPTTRRRLDRCLRLALDLRGQHPADRPRPDPWIATTGCFLGHVNGPIGSARRSAADLRARLARARSDCLAAA